MRSPQAISFSEIGRRSAARRDSQGLKKKAGIGDKIETRRAGRFVVHVNLPQPARGVKCVAMKATFQVVEEAKRAGVIQNYAVAGAVGAIFYIEPFQTGDIDFLVHFPVGSSLLVSLEPIHEWLRSHDYRMDNSGSFIVEGWPIQFVPVSDELSSEALKKAQYLPYDETFSVRVVRPEYLAAEALRLRRPKDIQRISMLLLSDDFDRNAFDEIVVKFGLENHLKRIEGQLIQ